MWYPLLHFIVVCFPLIMQDPGKPVRYTHWGNVAWCSQKMLSIQRARDHYGQSFVCVAESHDFCERDGHYRDGDESGEDMLRCVREAAQYGQECVE